MLNTLYSAMLYTAVIIDLLLKVYFPKLREYIKHEYGISAFCANCQRINWYWDNIDKWKNCMPLIQCGRDVFATLRHSSPSI